MLKSNILKSILKLKSNTELSKTIHVCIPQEKEDKKKNKLLFTLPCTKSGYDEFSNIKLKLDDLAFNHFYENKKMSMNCLDQLFFSYLKIQDDKTSVLSTKIGQPFIDIFDMINYIKIDNFVFDKKNIFVLKHLNKKVNRLNTEIYLPNLFSKDHTKKKIIEVSINTNLHNLKHASNIYSQNSQYLFTDGEKYISTKFADNTIQKEIKLNLQFSYKTVIKDLQKFKPKLHDIKIFQNTSNYVKELAVSKCKLHQVISKSRIQFLLLINEVPVDTFFTNELLNIQINSSNKVQLIFDTEQKNKFFCFMSI